MNKPLIAIGTLATTALVIGLGPTFAPTSAGAETPARPAHGATADVSAEMEASIDRDALPGGSDLPGAEAPSADQFRDLVPAPPQAPAADVAAPTPPTADAADLPKPSGPGTGAAPTPPATPAVPAPPAAPAQPAPAQPAPGEQDDSAADAQAHVSADVDTSVATP